MNMLSIIEKLQGRSNEERKELICEVLGGMGVRYRRQCYATGENIFVPSDRIREIGVGSHFDVVEGSPGANDNGSAVAVTLDLIERFQQNPPKHIGVQYFFFDEEELTTSGDYEGYLKGSRAYLEANPPEGYLGLIDTIGLYNMELVGSGDMIALWLVGKNATGPLLESLERSAKNASIPVHRIPNVVTHTADHIAFQEVGVKESFTITTVAEGDMQTYQEYLRAQAEGEPFEVFQAIVQQSLELSLRAL